MADPTGILINIAIQAAISLAIAALTPKQNTEGPRLDDRTVTTSTYGDEQPLGYGTVKMGGNVIWGLDIEEEKVKSDIGKGNPFSLGTQTMYFYYGTFAVALCRREIKSILRIYADGKKIYDQEAISGEVQHKMKDLSFKVHRGTETQQADPLIEADVGTVNCPAYRGTAYVVFNRLPLENFGNRIPVLTFVVAFADSLDDRAGYTNDVPGVDNHALESVSHDVERNITFAHTFDSGSSGSDDTRSYLSALNAENGELLYSRTFDEMSSALSLNSFVLRASRGPWILMSSGDTFADNLILIDKETLRVTDITLTHSSKVYLRNANFYNDVPAGDWVGQVTNGIYVCGDGPSAIIEVLDGEQKRYYSISGNLGETGLTAAGAGFACLAISDAGLFSWIAGSGTGTYQIDQPAATTIYDSVVQVLQGQQTQNKTQCFVVYQDGGTNRTEPLSLYVARITVGSLGVPDRPKDFVLTTVSGDVGSQAKFYYNPDLDYMLFEISDTETICYDWDSDNDQANITVVWTKTGSEHPWTVNEQGSDKECETYENGVYVRYNGDAVYFIEWETGEISGTEDRSSASFPGADGQVYVDTSNGVIYSERMNGLITTYGHYYFDPPRTRGIESLQTVVEDIALRTKLVGADIDATALSTKSVRGYLLASSMSYRAAIEPLATAFNFYGVEQDGVITFKFHDAVSVATIPEADLLRSGFENIFEEVRGQELETPRALFITHKSPDHDDKKMVQGARRISSPASTMNSVGERHLEIPLYLTNAEGAEIAERILYESWVQRESVRFRLPPRYMKLLPNDVLTVTAEGRTEATRINRIGVGADLEMEIEGVIVDGEVYTQALPGNDPIGSPNYTEGGLTAQATDRIIGLLHDIPMLDDGHLSGRTRAVMYFTAARSPTAGGQTFPGAGLSTSFNDAPFEGRSAASTEMAYGILTTIMADIPDPNWNGIQGVSLTFDAMAGIDQFVSVTEDNMVQNNANTALLVKSDGTTEIIGFRDVVANDANTFTLTGFMRGKRGTDTMATDYASSTLTYIVLVDASWFNGYYESLARDEGEILYRALPNSRGFLNFVTKSKTLKLRSLMPYSPSHVIATVNGADYDITWERRTRQGGHWFDWTGTTPLAEDTESYEVDILNGTGGAVLRTLSGTTESVTYTLAQATTDFGGFPAIIYCRVYQLSAQVGRGFSYEAALET